MVRTSTAGSLIACQTSSIEPCSMTSSLTFIG
jgi:hypothetical protein